MPQGGPVWLTIEEIHGLHAAALLESGGRDGMLQPKMLESAMGRVKNEFSYAGNESITSLAASYAESIARNHAFNDANKRTGFLAAESFLKKNGYELDPKYAADYEKALTKLVDKTGTRQDLENLLEKHAKPINVPHASPEAKTSAERTPASHPNGQTGPPAKPDVIQHVENTLAANRSSPAALGDMKPMPAHAQTPPPFSAEDFRPAVSHAQAAPAVNAPKPHVEHASEASKPPHVPASAEAHAVEHAVENGAKDATHTLSKIGKSAGIVGGVVFGVVVAGVTKAEGGTNAEAAESFYTTAAPYGQTQADLLLHGNPKAAAQSATVEAASDGGCLAVGAAGAFYGSAVGPWGTAIGGVGGCLVGGIGGGLGMDALINWFKKDDPTKVDLNAVRKALPTTATDTMPPEVQSLISVRNSDELLKKQIDELREHGGLDHVNDYFHAHGNELKLAQDLNSTPAQQMAKLEQMYAQESPQQQQSRQTVGAPAFG